MKKPVKSNRVKPTSSAAKVRMADDKATKAANAKAPRYPRGTQGYGMSTSKGSAKVVSNPSFGPNAKEVNVYGKGAGKKSLQNARGIMKTVKNSNASGLKGTKKILKADQGYNMDLDKRYIYEIRKNKGK